MKKALLKQINEIKEQIKNYDFKIDLEKDFFIMPNFMYLLQDLKNDKRNYNIVSELVIDFFKTIKGYEGRMIDNVLQHFLFINSDVQTCEFEILLMEKLCALTNNFTDIYYTDVFSSALQSAIKYEIVHLRYDKNNERVIFSCKLEYGVQVINFREKMWQYTFNLLKSNTEHARLVFMSYIMQNYSEEVDEQFVQNDLVYIKKYLKESDKDSTVLQIFLLNLKYCLKAYGIDFIELGIELNFTARLYFIINLSYLTLGESTTWNSSREMQYNLIKGLFQENANFDNWWNALFEVNKDQIIDDAFILFFDFLMKDMPDKLLWFIEKLLTNDVLHFMKFSFSKAVFDLGIEDKVYALLENSKSKVRAEWLMNHLIILNNKNKLKEDKKKFLLDIFENKLNEIEIFYNETMQILEKDKGLFNKIVNIIITKIPSNKALQFFESMNMEVLKNIIECFDGEKEQKDKLNFALNNKSNNMIAFMI
jgi:hypothetical protein